MKYHARAHNGELTFASDYARSLFFKQADGKDIILEVDDAPSRELRAYLRGGIVPFVFWQNPAVGWKNYTDCWNSLKLEFFGEMGWDLKGNRVKIAKSTAGVSKRVLKKLVDDVVSWMEGNGYEVSDPEAFKKWKDSAPPQGEIYPELARLMERHKNELDKMYPWKKKALVP